MKQRIHISIILLIVAGIFPGKGLGQTLFSENFEACGTGNIGTGGLCNWKQINVSGSWSNWKIYSSCQIIAGTRTIGLRDDNWAVDCDYDWDNANNKIAYYYSSKVNAVGYNSLKLNFKWRCGGESTFDYGKVVYSFDGISWSDVTATQYQGQTTTQTVTNLAMPGALDNQQFYIGFRWINDGSLGSSPGFTVDDISITATLSCSAPSPGTIQSAQTICYNTAPSQLSFSVAPSGGSGSYVYQWQSSAAGCASFSDIGGATSNTYSPPALTATTCYRCRVGSCATPQYAYTNNITITVLAAFSAGALTGGGGTICNGGDPSAMTANPSGGAGTYAYQWYYKDGTGCPSGGGATSIAGATSQTYDPLAGLTLTRSYQCQIDATGSPDCGSATWSSNCVTVTVNADPSITVQPADGMVCTTGGSNNFSVTVTGGVSVTYQWQYNSGTWNNVVNGTPAGATYTNATTSTMTISGISAAGNYQYRCVITDAGNGCTSPLNSNAATLAVASSPPTSVDAGEDQYICSNPATMAATGSGTWSVLNGAGTITTPTSATTTVNVTNPSTSVTFRWGQTNGCGTAYDDVVINRQ